MSDLLTYMDPLNLFSLHGSYFENHENRFTASILFLLSEFRSDFLPAFLTLCRLSFKSNDCSKIRIRFQIPHQNDMGVCRIPDAEIRLDDIFHIVIEAKIRTNPLGLEQMVDYAQYLADSEAEQKRLICITQSDCFENNGEPATFEELRSHIEPLIISKDSCLWFQWYHVLDLMKSCVPLTAREMKASESRVLKGQTVKYSARLCSLFLREVESKMYHRKDIDALPHGEVVDAIIAVQNRWFMNIALKHRVWFPNNLGGRAARYVAHYETRDAENLHPCQIAYIARNRVMWNGITVKEAMTIDELKHMFDDKDVLDVIQKWPSTEKHCIVLTDPLEDMKRPLGLGTKRTLPRIMAGRFFSVATLANASSIDDLC